MIHDFKKNAKLCNYKLIRYFMFLPGQAMFQWAPHGTLKPTRLQTSNSA